MNGFTPEEMSRGGDAAAAVAAVVAAAAAAAASAGNGAAAGAGAEVPGAVAVSAAGPPGAAGPGPGQLCCLREDGERCGRAAGNASFSKRIQKSISQKKVKIELDKSVRHLYICDYHKNLIQSVRNRRKRKGSDDDGGDSPVQDIDTPEVDLYQLQVNTLRRYKRHFKLPTRPGLNKAQLVEVNKVQRMKSMSERTCHRSHKDQEGLNPSGVIESGSVGRSSSWFQPSLIPPCFIGKLSVSQTRTLRSEQQIDPEVP
ncbi:histone deacetylase complex subunit SAP30 isoform X3 [Pteropus medius]|uniref:histone deacetylase complex subunit SAP30 isoform X3 n=1 Tax=Pteropus vampyrus TaxID=132908 RepID=UPI00196B26E1|nr:histone deacetylase complex subunit SAP30 isoform X3 [Pteropus giganteus]